MITTIDLHDEDITELIEDILYEEFRPYMTFSDAYEIAEETRKRIVDVTERKVKEKILETNKLKNN